MKRLLLPLALLLAACGQSGAAVRIVDLRVDYETTPMTVESARPQFSWRMTSDAGTASQRAYEIEVFSEAGERLWTSGRVAGRASVGIAYAGPQLAPASHYDWRVTVWPQDGASSGAESWFETGFMTGDPKAWSGAQWIGGGDNDRVFEPAYLSVFQLAFDLQLDRQDGSERAAFLLGGNDFRLMDANLNVHGVDNGEDESFFALELDTSGIDGSSGQAQLHVYRVGHTRDDSRDVPLASLPVPTSLINAQNRYEPHRVYLQSIFGTFSIWIDGEGPEHRLTPYDAERSAFSAQGLPVSPLGSGGNYIAYPMVGDIGFWLKRGESARFSNIEVRHLRSPSNLLFAAATPAAEPYPEVFLETGSGIRMTDGGAYEVAAIDGDTVILADPGRAGVPMLRGRIGLDDKPIRTARLYATARGIYELYINGERVGDAYFAPGLTQYDKHHSYQSYDVTRHLESGQDNVIGAWLGEGWWSGNATYTGSNWNFFGDRQSLLARLVVTYEDGTTTELVTTPGDWKVYHDGPVRYGSFFQGEIYDARREAAIAGWSTADYDDSRWSPAEVVPLQGSAFLGDRDVHPDRNDQLITSYDDMQLIGHAGRSPSIVETLEAVSVTETRPGVFVYDMGQNMVGFPRIRIEDATAGQPIILRYAEVLYPDLEAHEGLEGTPMMENLRAALVHDIYYPKGGGEVIQPRFTFHGYRYVEISGVESAPPPAAVQGLVVSSVAEFSADYRTSNESVNRLWENIRWSMRGNFLSIPTDTPARNERMGWSGDISVFARTANYMGHVNPFMTRHLLAMRDLQSDAGRFPDVAPVGGGFGGTLWGSAGVIVAWETYRQYGDISLLRDHYPAMRRYVDYLRTRRDGETGVLIEGPLGDWLSPEGERNDNSLLWEAYNVYLLDIVATVAASLGETADAAEYRERHAARKAFFNDNYIDAATGRTVSAGLVQRPFGPPPVLDPEARGRLIDTQASYAIPIALDVLDEENLARARNHLAESVERANTDDGGQERPPYSLMTGFIGTAALGDALTSIGRDDLAYRLLQQTSYPSWLYPVLNGATTIWERLNSYTVEAGFGGNNSMNSFNHYAFGAVGGWLMSRSLGIRPTEGSAGYERFVLTPMPDPTGQMTWARGHYDSFHGRIESEWAIEGNHVRYAFTIPDNTTAMLVLPGTDVAEVMSEPAVRPSGQEGSDRVYQLTPGRYAFTVTRPLPQ